MELTKHICDILEDLVHLSSGESNIHYQAVVLYTS